MFDIPMNVKGSIGLSDLATGGLTGQQLQTQPMQQNQYNQQTQMQMQGQGQWQQPIQQAQPQGQWQQPMQQAQPMQQVQPQGQWQQPQQAQGQWQQSMQQPQGQWQQPMQQPQQAQPIQQTQPRQRPAATGVTLRKGQKVALNNMCQGLDFIQVGLGWDLGPNGQGYDLDVEAFLLDNADKVIGDDWFVFYNQPESPDGSVRLLGDSTNGAGAGDDEIIQIQLSRVNPAVQKILFIVSINEAKQYGYNFSNVANAYVRIVDVRSNTELARFQLTDYYSNVNSMMVGELYRYNGQWKFNSIGDGVSADLLDLCVRYGVNVAD